VDGPTLAEQDRSTDTHAESFPVNLSGSGPEPASGLTVRSVAIGTLLIALGTIWTCLLELIFHIGNMAEVVPAPSALVMFVSLLLLMVPLRLVSRRLGLGSRELVVIFMMCMMALPMASQGLWGWFFGNIIGLSDMAYGGNSAPALHYLTELPSYVVPKGLESYRAYVDGVEMTPPAAGGLARLVWEIKGPVVWSVWLPVLGFWTILLVTLFAMMLFLNVILRKPWLEGERLRFPLAIIPAEICDMGPPGERRLVPRVVRDRLFLVGLGMVVVMHCVAALHFYWPNFPGWNASLRVDLQNTLFSEHPWDKMRVFSFNVMPLMVGVFYFVDPAVTGSILFFYVLGLLEGLFGGMTGMSGYRSSDGNETFPFLGQQWLGGMIAYGLAAIVFLRRHLLHVARRALGLARPGADEHKEACSYPVALWGFIVCAIVLVVWSHYASLGVLWGVAFFFLLFVSTMAAIRIRGESGAPVVHMMAYVPFLFYAFLGTRVVGVVPACVMALMFFLMHGQYMMLAPTQMEALKVSGTTGISQRGMFVALIAAFLFALVLGAYLRLQLNHRMGAANLHRWSLTCGQSRLGNFDRSNNWKEADPAVGSPGDAREAVATAIGAAVMTGLMVLRRIFARFPLHPVGYVIGTSISAGWMMGSVLVAWLAKTLVMKLGGIRVYRRLMPMFIGFIVGDALMFLILGTIGVIVAAQGGTAFRMYVW